MSKNRYYTNKEGLIVEVTKEHLDTAVTLKIELQKMSPSLRCDWKKHKKMMEEEGFEDSDTNEGYRILVKDYQRQVGLLTPLSKHVGMVKANKLESLNNLLGELYSEKRDNQLVLAEINKFKRDFHLSKVIAEEIVKEFNNFKVTLPKKYDPYNEGRYYSKNKAIITLTDLHIGEVINDVYGNSYNYEIAKKRMQLYLKKVIKNGLMYQVETVNVAGLGDFVEHLYMRAKQSRNAEFGLAQQILKASELIIEFLIGLSEVFDVEYSGIAGNHDRLQGDKDLNFDDDNANVIINYNINTAIQFINSDRLKYIPTEDGATEMNIEANGKKIKLVHGHLDNGNKKDKMKGYISMQNDFFDCLVYGHLHHYHVEDSDHGRLAIGVGCMSGRNDYGKHFSAATNASQMMLIISGDGELIPLKVDLQIV